MNSSLFVYGSLECDEVMAALVGRTPTSVPATLAAHRRGILAGRIYPGIVPDPQSEVSGRVYFDLDEAALDILDWFEADEYERLLVAADCADGRRTNAFAYIVCAEYAELVTDVPWNLAEFRRLHLDDYVRGCKRLRDEWIASAGVVSDGDEP